MTIVRSAYKSYDFDRMVVLFTMMDGDAEVPCAISTTAMDDLERSSGIKAEQREAQFMRLREQIEEHAARKFLRVEFEGQPPRIVLRSIDFRH